MTGFLIEYKTGFELGALNSYVIVFSFSNLGLTSFLLFSSKSFCWECHLTPPIEKNKLKLTCSKTSRYKHTLNITIPKIEGSKPVAKSHKVELDVKWILKLRSFIDY